MKKILSLILVLVLVLAFTGCTTVRDSVPATQVKGDLNGHPFSFTGPKDLVLESLDVTADTNGVSLHIKNLNARTNPDVITTTGEAQAKMISATGDAVTQALGAAGKAAGQAAGAVVK